MFQLLQSTFWLCIVTFVSIRDSPNKRLEKSDFANVCPSLRAFATRMQSKRAPTSNAHTAHTAQDEPCRKHATKANTLICAFQQLLSRPSSSRLPTSWMNQVQHGGACLQMMLADQ